METDINADKLLEVNIVNILNSLSDGIYITNGEGTTIWLNKSSEKLLGKKSAELIGKNVKELEDKGLVAPSVTKLAIEKKDNVSIVQTLNNDRKLFASSHILFRKNGEIDYVVTHSRDITESVLSNSQFEETENLLRYYIEELRNTRLQQLFSEPENNFIGKSKEHKHLIGLIDRIARVNAAVLLIGETGVGKNVVAKMIHELSDRSDKAFIHINCCTIPELLFESELFGYSKGAFSGADAKGKIGLVQLANQGTLFLDEVSELPLQMQSKLLQLIQDKTFLPIGSTKEKQVDIRIIAASNKDLLKMTENGFFRSDLFYRLNVLPVKIPPIRDRKEDVFPLIKYYLDYYNKKHGFNRLITHKALEILNNYHWPGNFRELENLIEYLVITATHNEIDKNDIPDKIKNKREHDIINVFELAENTSLLKVIEQIEKDIIVKAISKYQTTREIAKNLGITQSLLMRRFNKYNLSTKEKNLQSRP